MDGWTDGRTDGWTDGRMDGWTDGWMDGTVVTSVRSISYDKWREGAFDVYLLKMSEG